jgi:carbon storage regulator
MLVLSRRWGQEILIGDDIRVKVTKIEKGVVKLGIEAPKHIYIMRKELLEHSAKNTSFLSIKHENFL